MLGGIFDKEDIETRLKKLEQTTLEENFWKDKNLVKKTVKQKKIFEDIINSYKKVSIDLNNLKDLYSCFLLFLILRGVFLTFYLKRVFNLVLIR